MYRVQFVVYFQTASIPIKLWSNPYPANVEYMVSFL